MIEKRDNMRLFVYFILAAVAFIMFKAFFLDEYLENRGKTDVNTTMQSPEPIEKVEEKETAPTKQDTNESETKKQKIIQSHEKMPLDELGDEIADKIKL